MVTKDKELTYFEGKSWKELVADSITSADSLNKYLNIDINQINKIIKKYPLRINPYYLSLIKEKNDPIYKQAIPDLKELEDQKNLHDPLCEEKQSPVQGIIKRYPDRVILLVSNECALYCRFCMRKRKVGINRTEKIEKGIDYIKKDKAIKEVILSGGDTLLLDDDEIENILKKVCSIDHVEVVRIHSRVLCTLPQRITTSLINILKKYHPLYVNTHFNHPSEITDVSSKACLNLIDNGISVGCQTVLLKGINDNQETMKELFRKLYSIRVKPYYLHHPDLVKGTDHFRPEVKKGLEIMRGLRGNISGMCIPHYMIDLASG